MCPLYPLHIVLLYLCLILPLLLAVVQGSEEFSSLAISGNPLNGGSSASLVFNPSKFKTQEQNVSELQVTCYDCADLFLLHQGDGAGEDGGGGSAANSDDGDGGGLKLVLEIDRPEIARLSSRFDERQPRQDYQLSEVDPSASQEVAGKEIVIDLKSSRFDSASSSNWTVLFNLTGEFLGFANVRAKVVRNKVQLEGSPTAEMAVDVVRKKTIQSKLFSYSVAILVSLAYINMGCAMDLQVVRQTLKRPVGPLIGLCCQYIAMPLIAFGLGFIFIGDAPMRLGLFVTGCSPGGGASNIWTVMFGGNLDLSVTMTALSTFAAFFMMPAWILTLGQHLILDDDSQRNIVIPYYKICIYAFFLVVPLSLGFLIRRKLPKAADFLVKILKPMSLFLILFILIFGIWANLYIFKLMNWQVFLAGMGLPWIGFAFGCTLARALHQTRADIIAIAIETGIQNTGMSIFILWFTLDHPLGDITAVVPVAAATMTPFPLLAALAIKKLAEVIQDRSNAGYKLPVGDEENGGCGGGGGNGVTEEEEAAQIPEKNGVDVKHKNIWLGSSESPSSCIMLPLSESNQKLIAKTPSPEQEETALRANGGSGTCPVIPRI